MKKIMLGLFMLILLSTLISCQSEKDKQLNEKSSLTFDDAVGYSLSEMALQLADESLYSMATFGDIAKTSGMQITYHWSISVV